MSDVSMNWDIYRATMSIPLTPEEWQAGYEAARDFPPGFDPLIIRSEGGYT